MVIVQVQVLGVYFLAFGRCPLACTRTGGFSLGDLPPGPASRNDPTTDRQTRQTTFTDPYAYILCTTTWAPTHSLYTTYTIHNLYCGGRPARNPRLQGSFACEIIAVRCCCPSKAEVHAILADLRQYETLTHARHAHHGTMVASLYFSRLLPPSCCCFHSIEEPPFDGTFSHKFRHRPRVAPSPRIADRRTNWKPGVCKYTIPVST